MDVEARNVYDLIKPIRKLHRYIIKVWVSLRDIYNDCQTG